MAKLSLVFVLLSIWLYNGVMCHADGCNFGSTAIANRTPILDIMCDRCTISDNSILVDLYSAQQQQQQVQFNNCNPVRVCLNNTLCMDPHESAYLTPQMNATINVSSIYDSYLIDIGVTQHHGSFDIMPNPIWFDHSFPGKPPRWTTLRCFNDYDVEIQIDNTQTTTNNPMFAYHSPVASQAISPHSTADIGAIQFDPNSLNYLRNKPNQSEFDDILRLKYAVFTRFKSYFDSAPRGVTLREIFIERYHRFLWAKISPIVQAVAHLHSPNMGKIPLIVHAELMMPRFVANSMHFGAVLVGEVKQLHLLIQNPFNRRVQIALIEAIDGEEAIFYANRTIQILEAYSVTQYTIEFAPKEGKSYDAHLYLRNNMTTAESFNVSGVGQEAKLRLQTAEDGDDDEDDDDEEEEDMFDEHELNIIYPLQHVADAYLPASLTANAMKQVLNNVLKNDDDDDVAAPSIQPAVEHEDARIQMKFDSYDLDKITSKRLLMLHKTFILRNEGNIGITLHAITVDNTSACIDDGNNMWSNKKKKKQTPKDKKRLKNKKKKRKRRQKKYKKWITNWISYVSKWMEEPLDEVDEEEEEEEDEGMDDHYYLEQNGMRFVDYDNDSDSLMSGVSTLLANRFGVIGCEMFPLQLAPDESRAFVLLFSYDLSSPSVSSQLSIETNRITFCNNSIHSSESVYFSINASFEVDPNLFDSIWTFKSLQKSNQFILVHSCRVILVLICAIALHMTQILNPICDISMHYCRHAFNAIKRIIRRETRKGNHKMKRKCYQIQQIGKAFAIKMIVFCKRSVIIKEDDIKHDDDEEEDDDEGTRLVEDDEEEEEEEETQPHDEETNDEQSDDQISMNLDEKMTDNKKKKVCAKVVEVKGNRKRKTNKAKVSVKHHKIVKMNRNNRSSSKKEEFVRKKGKKICSQKKVQQHLQTVNNKKTGAKTRTVLACGASNQKRVVTSYASRAKGIESVQMKPRKPPRPHHHHHDEDAHRVMDELLAESTRIEKKEATSISIASLYRTKPPLSSAANIEAAPISNEAELVIPDDIDKIWSIHSAAAAAAEKEESDADSSKSTTNSKSRLNRGATPFVPKHAKSKYDAAGELIGGNETDHTFTSLYSDSDSNPFVLEMAAAIQGRNYHYHVPDGILSSPTKEKEEEECDPHYNRILKDYPFNYSATPSPKQLSPMQLQKNNGFAVDLQSLGYNVSPNRKHQTTHITSNDLFCDKNQTKPNKHEKQAVQRAPIRLSQLF